MLESFFMTERLQVGWRYLALWIVLTNLAFLLGLGIETVLFGSTNLYIAALLMAIAQAWVLDRHIPVMALWSLGSLVGWWIGIFASQQIVGMTAPELSLLLRILVASSIGGFVAGIFQWLVLRPWVEGLGWWWMFVGALGWLGLFPSLVLMRFLERFDIPILKTTTTQEQVTKVANG